MTGFTRRLQAATVVTSGGNPPGGGPVDPVAHGDEITTANTGYTAYYDTGLGRKLQQSDLQVISGAHYISDYVSAGGTIRRKHFTGSINVDINNVTFEACLFDTRTVNLLNGNHASGTQFNFCTIDPPSVGSEGVAHQGYSAYRCYIRGSSDGLRINGGASTQNITECYIRVKMAAFDDHNDTLQNVGGNGQVNIVRCNLSVNPEGGIIPAPPGQTQGGPNGVLQSADMPAGANFQLLMQDCLVDGSNSAFTLRLYDGGASPNVQYTITGNKHVRPGANTNEVHRGTANTTPLNQITWSNNRWADNNAPIALA